MISFGLVPRILRHQPSMPSSPMLHFMMDSSRLTTRNPSPPTLPALVFPLQRLPLPIPIVKARFGRHPSSGCHSMARRVSRAGGLVPSLVRAFAQSVTRPSFPATFLYNAPFWHLSISSWLPVLLQRHLTRRLLQRRRLPLAARPRPRTLLLLPPRLGLLFLRPVSPLR